MKGGTPPVGRFAPSPTGRMHLGNAFTALLSWLSARSRGGRWILRIEDLDPQRSKPEYAVMIEDDLLWLGLDWDEGGVSGAGPHAPYRQSLRGALYRECLGRLEAAGLTYPCTCTRADIMATQAPHPSDGRIVYPGTCRPAAGAPPSVPERPHAVRLMVSGEEIGFTDGICGPQRFNLADECGDFVLRRADGAWAYQLAVVADDAAMGVTEVVRGNDLLLSAAQQTWLCRLLGFDPPAYAHVPLVCNAEGRRLSKRDSGAGMEELRRRFTAAETVGILAWLAGLRPSPAPCMPSDLLPGFSVGMVTSVPSVVLPAKLFPRP